MRTKRPGLRFLSWGIIPAGLVIGAWACGASVGAAASSSSDAATNADDAGADVALVDPFGPPGPFGSPPVDNDDGPPGTVTVDDAAAEPNAAYSVTLTTQPFTVPANTEAFKCQDFANPFQGQGVDIIRYDLSMNPGSHHMLLFYNQGATDGPVVDCSGLQTGPYTFGAQSQKVTETYPAGVGAAIPAGTGFTVNMHYVNAGVQDITGVVKVTMFVAQPGVVTQHAGVFQFVQTNFSIPPDGQPHAISASCSVPQGQDVNLLSTGAHMHQRATQFIATAGSTVLYQTDQWAEPPPRMYMPSLPLAAGSTIDWSCTYVNDPSTTGGTPVPLTFGESALNNAMCNFNATYYPVADPSNPVISCIH
jgi:hypothetical protein